MPVKVGLASGAFAFRAVVSAFSANAANCAVEIGLPVSLVLSTLPRPTIDLVMPPTVPVKVGLASGAFASRAANCAVDTGLERSAVLSTLPRPTIDLLMPPTVPVKVGLARLALRVSSFSIAERIVSDAVIAPETDG